MSNSSDQTGRASGGGVVKGILAERAAGLGQGCCSVGAQLRSEEVAQITSLAAALDPGRFQHWAEASAGGVLREGPGGSATRLVDGACIFLNRPGFDGGAGCALHLAAVDEGDSPVDWKPTVCWQLPFRVDVGDDGVRRLRAWNRTDWGEEPVWWCTEPGAEPTAYVGTDSVAVTMADELRALVGPEVAVTITTRVVAD